MFFVTVREGQVVSGPELLSPLPTLSPNIAWKPAQLKAHGFFIVDLSCAPGEKIDYENPTVTEAGVTYPRIPKTAEELKAEAVAAFNVRTFTDRLNVSFTMEELAPLASFYAILKDQAAFPSFESVKTTLNGLLAMGALSQAQFNRITGILLEQNINLDDF
jgi:hypothetical protein